MKLSVFAAVAVLCPMTNLLSSTTLRVDPGDSPAEGVYATIQSAVDQAQPGDTIEIRGGVYQERVVLSSGGTPEAPIRIQPMENHVVVVLAGHPINARFEPVEGVAQVYQATLEPGHLIEGAGIWEMPSRVRLSRVHSPGQVAQRLASWHYDESTQILTLRTSGVAGAGELSFWAEHPTEPALRIDATDVEVRGLQFSLGRQGVEVPRGKSRVTIEQCRAFCNQEAGLHISGDHHVLRNNEVFQNNGYGIQMRFGINHIHVVGNVCYLNGPNNGDRTGSSEPTDLGLYSQGTYNVIERNIIEGIHKYAYRNKASGHPISPTNILRHNVIRGHLKTGPYGVYGNTILVDGLGMRAGMYMNGGEPSPLRSWGRVDPKGIQRISNLFYPLVEKEDPMFVDPVYRDYRLQSDSPYPGRGAFPGQDPVYFVDPIKGSDENSGLSLEQALATASEAISRMPASGTLYLLPGRYEEPLILATGGLDQDEPLRIRAHAKSPGVHIVGGLELNGTGFVQVEGLEFLDSELTVQDAGQVTIRHCLFLGANSGVRFTNSPGGRVEYCTFQNSNAAVVIQESRVAGVSSSLFDSTAKVIETDEESLKTLFSNFNGAQAWKVVAGDKTWTDLKSWNEATGNDANSLTSTVPLGKTLEIPMRDVLARSAADFGPIGARYESAGSRLEINNVRVGGLSPDTATLLWDSPRQASLAEIQVTSADGTKTTHSPNFIFQIMGEFFDITDMMPAFFSSQRHFALQGLKPDTQYVASITPLSLNGDKGDAVEISFHTPKEFASGETFFVSPEGSDSAEGRSRQNPWRSLSHALSQVKPGDEVWLLPGIYREVLRPSVAGSAEHPIRIRSAEPLGAVIDLAANLPAAVEILNTANIEVDGLLITGGNGSASRCFMISHAEGITIRNCEVDYPEGTDFEKLKFGHAGIMANRAPGLRVENNLILCASVAVALSHTPGAVVQQNTFLGEGNYGIVIVAGSEDESYTVLDNLFYRVVFGYKTGPAIWVFEPVPALQSDHNLFFIPEEAKGTIGAAFGVERQKELSDWQAKTGLDAHSVAAQPQFINPQVRDFRLAPDSPGRGAASDGGDIGRRKEVR